jgi:hypothetical protein
MNVSRAGNVSPMQVNALPEAPATPNTMEIVAAFEQRMDVPVYAFVKSAEWTKAPSIYGYGYGDFTAIVVTGSQGTFEVKGKQNADGITMIKSMTELDG